jgi:C_GCAxxG_C_C family probable redox protein
MYNGKIAEETYHNGFNCAQSVLTAYSGKYHMDDKTAKMISCGFGGGCARQSLTCGAVTGAFMVIGLKYGKAEKEEVEARDITYKKVNEFSTKFKSMHNSINCGELLGIDLATEKGRAYFKENLFSEKKCSNFIKDACNILDEMEL